MQGRGDSSGSNSRFIMAVSSDRVQVVVNTVLGVAFLLLIPVALLTGLKQSVPFLVFLSLWALVAAHWSGALAAWAAMRVTETEVDKDS
jgi:hypothetical protein